MAVGVDHLATIRSWVGSAVGRDGDTFDGDDLNTRFGVLGSAEAVALQILQQRRADIVLGNPVTWSISGDHSEDWMGNLQALDKHIAQLERMVGAGTVTVTTMTREGPRR